MWLMLQQPDPDDYVIATGESHTVREFLDLAFKTAGLEWKDYVVADERFLRPAEVPHLRGNSAKARRVLGWAPQTSFEELVREMVEADLRLEGVAPGHLPPARVSGAITAWAFCGKP